MGGMITTLTLPRLGETMDEARVTAWLVKPGMVFRRGDVLLEVETDKTVVEVPALQAGTLVEQLVAEGQTVALGAPIATIEADDAGAGTATAAEAATPQPDAAKNASAARAAPQKPKTKPVSAHASKKAASPAARATARQTGTDLSALDGTGRGGRITGADVRFAAVPLAPLPDGSARRDALTIVLVHGLFDHPGGWRNLPAKLTAAGHRVLALTLPGHAADATPVEHTPEQTIANWVAANLAEVKGKRLAIVGHSVGAVFAVHLAEAAAGQVGTTVERLVLSAPAGLGARINQEFIDAMAGARTPAALARALSFLDAGPVSVDALAAELLRLDGVRGTMVALARMLASDGIQQCDIAGRLARLGVPVAALFGLADRIIDWRDCATLPSAAAIHLCAGAGHLPHAAEPNLCFDLITNHNAGAVRLKAS